MSDYPRYNVARITRLRNRIVDEVFYEHYNSVIVGDDIARMTQALRRVLPGDISYSVLYETVRSLSGQELTPPVCHEFAWRVAGNVARLKAGAPALPWVVQQADEWVLVQVLRALRGRNHYDRSGMWVDARVLAGTPCPKRLSKFWTHTQCAIVARSLGFTRPWGAYPYTSGEQLVGLRFFAYIEAARSAESLWFKEVGCSSSCLKWNRELLKLRLRHYPCPRAYDHPCHECVFGYEACDAATHPRNYHVAYCESCYQTRHFDPDLSTAHCLECDLRQRNQKRAARR